MLREDNDLIFASHHEENGREFCLIWIEFFHHQGFQLIYNSVREIEYTRVVPDYERNSKNEKSTSLSKRIRKIDLPEIKMPFVYKVSIVPFDEIFYIQAIF